METTISFGSCKTCGQKPTDAVFVPRRKVINGNVWIGPDYDGYHNSCLPLSLINDHEEVYVARIVV